MPVVSNTSPILNLALIDRLSLILELKAELILLDEREARMAAKDLELSVTGVLGILLRAWHQKRIPSLQHELKMLRNEAGFHIANHLYDKILQNIKDTG